MSVHALKPEYEVQLTAQDTYEDQHNTRHEQLAKAKALWAITALRKTLASIFGGVATALVLEQILYWHSPDKSGKSKLRARYQGIFWLAKSREEMMSETGISIRQYKKAIESLKKMDVIDYRVGGFAGKPTPCIQLKLSRLSYLIEKRANRLVQNVPNVWAVTCQTNTGILTENTTVNTSAASLLPNPTESSTNPTGGDEMILKKNDPKKVAKVPTTAASMQAKFAGTKMADLKNITASGMYYIWAEQMVLHEHATFVPTFTMKQKGQMVQLAQMWGDDAGKVLAFTLENWVRFCKVAQAQADLKTFPMVPSTDFLLKHGGIAMNVFMSREVPAESAINCIEPKKKILIIKKVSQNQVPAPVSQPVQPPPAPVIADEDKVPTAEEFNAWLASQ